MKRNDIKRLYFKGASVTVAAITRKATHLGLSDENDADYTESEVYRIVEVIREELARNKEKPAQKSHSKVLSLPFPSFRKSGDEQFDYLLNTINALKRKFNNDLDEFEKVVLNHPEKAAELAKLIDQLLSQVEAGNITSWKLKEVDKPKLKVNLREIYPARLANALRSRL